MTENAVYAYSEENRDPVERTSIPLFHYFVNNVNLGGEKNVPVKIQTCDILTGKNPGTHYYTHVLDNNKVKTSGPVSGAESSRVDSNANADLHNEETKAPSDNSIPESSENSNTNFAEEDTNSQPYSTAYKIPTSWYNSYYKTKAADRITTPQSTKSTPESGDILLPSTATQNIAENEKEIKSQFSYEDTDSYSTDDSAYWESMPEDQELLRNAAARDDANPDVTAWGRKQERIETLDRKANNLREAMQENETKARREPGTSL